MENNYSIKSYNVKCLSTLSLFLLIPLAVELISIYTGGSNNITPFLYISAFIYSLIRCKSIIKPKECIFLAIFYLWIFLNYAFFPGTEHFYHNSSFLIVIFIYVPLSILIIYNTSDWKQFFDIGWPYAIVATIISVVIVFANNVASYDELFSYMEFSYFLLPFNLICYVKLRQNKTLLPLLCFLTTLISMLIYGARAVVLFGFLFILFFELFSERGIMHLFKNLIKICIYVGIVLVFFNSIVALLGKISFLENSRFLTKLMGEELFVSESRDYIYEKARLEISKMGLGQYGIFGDRQFFNDIWPHNIIYEILLQFGWIFGLISIASLLILFMSNLRNKETMLVTLFFLTAIMGRYFISGSYLVEGRFWLMLFGLLSMQRIRY